MDQTQKDFADEKNEVELSLARTLLTQVESGKITYSQSQEIARYILAKMDVVKTQEDLVSALADISGKWQGFETISGLYRLKTKEADVRKQKLQEAHQKLQTLTNNTQ